MKNIKVTIISVLILSLLLSITATAQISSESTIDTNTRIDIDLEGLFPTFTQEDYDAGFQNYASTSSLVNLSDETMEVNETGISNAIGTVFQNNTEEPISEATINVIDAETEISVAIVQTDDEGRFQIIGLPDAVYNWEVSCEGYEIAKYNGYDVCAGEITSIFTFYLSDTEKISKTCNAGHNEIAVENVEMEDSLTNETKSEYDTQTVSTASFTSTPTLSSFTVGVNGIATTVSRYTYLTYVVASEALGYYQCQNYNMTDAQIMNYYAAQAVAANTFLEYAASVSNKHGSSYTVCNTTCCQTYDTTKTSEFVISGISSVCYRFAGDWYAYLQVYKSGSTYSYITGMYFAHCNGKTKTDSSDPSLKSVSCTNIDGSTTLSGHGYGLCQYGAAYLAKQGTTWTSILSFYYNSTTSMFCPYEN